MVTEERGIFHECVFIHKTETGFVEVWIYTPFILSRYVLVCVSVDMGLCLNVYVFIYAFMLFLKYWRESPARVFWTSKILKWPFSVLIFSFRNYALHVMLSHIIRSDEIFVSFTPCSALVKDRRTTWHWVFLFRGIQNVFLYSF